MKRSQGRQIGTAIGAFALSALITTPFAMAGLVGGGGGGGIGGSVGGTVGGTVNGAGGILKGTGGVVNGAGGVINGPGGINGTVNGTVNSTVNGNVNGKGASGNANASTNTSTQGSTGNVLDASLAGSGNVNASASAQLPGASQVMQAAYTTMQREKAAKQLVVAKAESIPGTVTDVENHYVSFVSNKGMTYVATAKNATKSALRKGSHIIANLQNYGQTMQLTLAGNVAASSNASTQAQGRTPTKP